jgi:putative endonuclease
MFCVYILRTLRDNGIYIGKTNDLKRRLGEHSQGSVSSTKARRPLTLLNSMECKTEEEALALEKEYKKGYKREQVKWQYQ